jgi:RsiW-degrading membrane proteinase PrsW (M82 family)
MFLTTSVALLIATLIPLAVLWFIQSRNMYQTGSFNMVLGSFGWGILVYAIVALFNSQILIGQGIVDSTTLVKFITPWLEEILKALLFIYLIRQINFTYFVDGAIYGFAIGIGFAIVENFEYVLAFQDAALGVAVSRVISTNLIHGAATAITGIAFGFARFYSGIKRILVILSGLAIGILLHLGFNNLVNEVNSSLLLIYAAATGIISTLIIFFIIRNGLSQAKNWIHEELGRADKVTSSESQLAQQVGSADKLLAPLEKMFGKSKANEVQKFLLIQARIGIHRKNLEKFQDETMRKTTRAEIESLHEQMNQIRKEVGPYSMAMLRSIFPESENQLWAQLGITIEERMLEPSYKRGGLWDKLDKLN